MLTLTQIALTGQLFFVYQPAHCPSIAFRFAEANIKTFEAFVLWDEGTLSDDGLIAIGGKAAANAIKECVGERA